MAKPVASKPDQSSPELESLIGEILDTEARLKELKAKAMAKMGLTVEELDRILAMG